MTDNSTLTLINSSEFYLDNEEVFFRSIPANIKVGNLTIDALRLLVYYLAKAGPYELATESGYFTGTLEQWLETLKNKLTFAATVEDYSELVSLTGLKTGDLAYVRSLGLTYTFNGESFPAQNLGIRLQGLSAYELAVEDGFVGTIPEWLEYIRGKSAYELAVVSGYEGTLQQWLDSLHGKSAYRIALDNGYIGTTEEWLASLKGASAYTIAVANGFNGTVTEWLASLKGVQGFSAYDIYTQEVPEGEAVLSLEDWLISLKGIDGVNGTNGLDAKSNYDLYVDLEKAKILTQDAWATLQSTEVGLDAYNEYVATVVDPDVPLSQEEWSETLKGEAGTVAYTSYYNAQLALILTEEAWLATLVGAKGADAKSNYQLYVDVEMGKILSLDAWADEQGTLENNTLYDDYVATVIEPDVPLTQVEWAETLKTSTEGETLHIAYTEAAIASILTQEAWLLTLIGPQGIQGVVDAATVGALVLGDTSGQTAVPVTDTDTLLAIIGKLQAQITDLQSRVTALETP